MGVKDRIRRLYERKGTMSVDERFNANLGIFRMVNGREPTQKELDQIWEDVWDQKPVDLKQSIDEVEKMVWEHER